MKLVEHNHIETLINPPPPWRIELNQYIRREQPFQLSYQDATGRLWNFTVRHAKIVPYEERQYLDCWCEETEENLDVEELHHNWSLRLDRIPEAGVIPISGKWRSNLDELQVEMHIHGRLAFAYKTKNEHVDSKLLETSPPVRRVVRRVSNTYWFLREVLRDRPDVLIISPENVRSLAQEKLKLLYQRYNLEIFS